MQKTQDYNDVTCTAAGGDSMKLFYMCGKHDPSDYRRAPKCGIYMSGKLWCRNGVQPEKTRAWCCGLERSEWEQLVQRRYLLEAGADQNAETVDMARAPNQAPAAIGCKCRFHPFKAGGSMVLEVIDKSVPGTCTLWAIRAAIPPGPLSDEIQKVQRGWNEAGRGANPQELYENIPTMYPKCHVIPGLPVPAIGRYPIQKAIHKDWPETHKANWYRLAIVISMSNPESFYRINALCNQKLQVNAAGPAQHAATYIQAPQLATAATHTPCGAASSSASQAPPPPPPEKREPPPPPPGPPPPRHSVVMKDGVRAFTPDAVMTMKVGQIAGFSDDKIEEC